jgi:hypothetical protein
VQEFIQCGVYQVDEFYFFGFGGVSIPCLNEVVITVMEV